MRCDCLLVRRLLNLLLVLLNLLVVMLMLILAMLGSGVLLLLLNIECADETRVNRLANQLDFVSLHVDTWGRRLLLQERVILSIQINV